MRTVLSRVRRPLEVSGLLPLSDQRHHIEDPAVRALVQEQVIAELRRIADALERGLIEGKHPADAVARISLAEPRPEEMRTITVQQAAYECGCSEDTIERRYRLGKAGIKRNGRIYFSSIEVERMKRGEI